MFRSSKTGLALAALMSLASCGGGGGDSGAGPAAITLSSTSAAKYSDTMVVTLVGSNLDQTLTLTSAGCTGFARSTTAPNVSTATTAYYTCRVSGVGNQTIAVAAGSQALANVAFTIEQPQVTLLVSNGAGVNGALVMTLRPQEAPITVDNFLVYVKAGFYNNTAFHRHARNDDLSTFVLQGGGYAAPVFSSSAFPAHKPTNAAIALEAGRGLSNVRYSVAMARTSVLNSATSEFFINTTNNAFLDTSGGGYAVFATVTTGTGVVDLMVAAPCNLSPVNFNSGFSVSPDCVPEPNLIVASATQTR